MNVNAEQCVRAGLREAESGLIVGWVPNVDLVLVAVGVDPPLAHQDVVLIRKLFEYTPKVCVLPTKVDVLTEAERHEILEFVREQLNVNFEQRIEVFPYSTRPGFGSLRSALEEQFIGPTLTTKARDSGPQAPDSTSRM